MPIYNIIANSAIFCLCCLLIVGGWLPLCWSHHFSWNAYNTCVIFGNFYCHQCICFSICSLPFLPVYLFFSFTIILIWIQLCSSSFGTPINNVTIQWRTQFLFEQMNHLRSAFVCLRRCWCMLTYVSWFRLDYAAVWPIYNLINEKTDLEMKT